jgi:hypothetical protein
MRLEIEVGTQATRLVELLLECNRRHGLFPSNVNIEDDFGITKVCWRGSNTEATNQGVPSKIIEKICKWRKVERAQGRQPNLGIREHYMEVTHSLEAFLQYSRLL